MEKVVVVVDSGTDTGTSTDKLGFGVTGLEDG